MKTFRFDTLIDGSGKTIIGAQTSGRNSEGREVLEGIVCATAELRMHKILDSRTERCFATATLNGIEIGPVTLSEPALAYRPKACAFISELFVADDVRRRGVATAIITRCCMEAIQAGCHSISLNVDAKKNGSAVRLYKRLGFTLAFEHDEENGMQLWLMSQPLASWPPVKNGDRVQWEDPDAEWPLFGQIITNPDDEGVVFVVRETIPGGNDPVGAEWENPAPFPVATLAPAPAPKTLAA